MKKWSDFTLSALLVSALACAGLACGKPSGAAPEPAPINTTPPPPNPPPPPPPPPVDAGPLVPVFDGLPPSPDLAKPADGGPTDGAGDALPGANLIQNPLAPTPSDLKDVGLFTSFPSLATTHPRAFYFEPKYPLYSNGLDKLRHLVLPEGTKIDTSKRGEWQFPVGTMFFKTFLDKDATGKARPVETRLVRRIVEAGTRTMQWEFAVYEWSEDGTTAKKIIAKQPTERMVTVNGKPSRHAIPSIVDCRQCHIANFTTVIGFDELRLNSPLPGQTKTQLDEITSRGWLTAPIAAPETIVDADPKRKWILEYMHGNCGHCHNGGMTAEEVTRVFDLRYGKFVANTFNKMTEGRTKPGIRIVPGKPLDSILMQAFARETNEPELNRMPLVGVQVADQDAVAKLRDWIMSLPPR